MTDILELFLVQEKVVGNFDRRSVTGKFFNKMINFVK